MASVTPPEIPEAERRGPGVLAAQQAQRLHRLLVDLHGRNRFYTRKLDAAGIRVLPQNLHEALVALEKDDVIRAALGPVVDEFLRLKHMEWVEYMRHVSDWEVSSYLEFF